MSEGSRALLIPGDRQISWPKLRSVAQQYRLSLPDADVARQVTGYERGTITPVGASRAWPVLADERISGRIALGSGSRDHALFVESGELFAAYHAVVADLSG